jgi:uncharacterized protein
MATHFLAPLLSAPDRPHRLINVTRNIVLATTLEGAFDSTRRRRGLLGRTSLPSDFALLIAPSNAIHMFGMTCPIDVLFARRSGEVIKRVIALQPRRIAIAWRAFAAIEFAADHEGVEGTHPGDRLAIE